MILEISELPSSLEEYLDLEEGFSDTPYGAVMLFLLALNLYLVDAGGGKDALLRSLGGKALNNGEMLKNEAARLDEQLKRYDYLPRVYFREATVENGYEVVEDLSVEFKDVDFENQENVKVFVNTNGADSARPVTVTKEDDQWKVSEFSSLLMGVREPDVE